MKLTKRLRDPRDIRKLSFQRVVRDLTCAASKRKDLRFGGDALLALHEAAERHIVNFMAKVNHAATHCGRVTIQLKDVELVKILCGTEFK